MLSTRLRSNSSPGFNRPQTVPAEMITNTPVDILRFIDQIDCSLWAATHSEDAILDSIGACFTSRQAFAWFRELVNSHRPRKPTINDIRRALLKDFGVENWEALMARYESTPSAERYSGGYDLSKKEGYNYYQTQEFKLRLSYLDEIEGLKDQIKFRNRRALEDGKRMNEMKNTWESIVSGKNGKIKQLEVAARKLEKEAEGLRMEAKERKLTKQDGSEEAFQRFERSIGEARERLRQDLGILSYDEDTSAYPTSSPLLRENVFSSFPLIKTVHWASASSSSLENISEVPQTSPPPPSSKTPFTHSPLTTPSENFSRGSSLPGLALTCDEAVEPLECDDLLSDWDKELVLSGYGGSKPI